MGMLFLTETEEEALWYALFYLTKQEQQAHSDYDSQIYIEERLPTLKRILRQLK